MSKDKTRKFSTADMEKKIAALTAENKQLKTTNADLLAMIFDSGGPCKDIAHCIYVPGMQSEIEQLKDDKRELVKGLEGLFDEELPIWEAFPYQKMRVLIDKHKEVTPCKTEK